MVCGLRREGAIRIAANKGIYFLTYFPLYANFFW